MFKELQLQDKLLEEKFFKLTKIIENLEKVAVAYSGGVDSTLLAYLCNRILGQNSIAITINSQFISESELKESVLITKKFGIKHEILNVDILSRTEVTANLPKRCFYCKDFIFQYIKDTLAIMGFEKVVDGSNVNDLSDYRPGHKALERHSIISPFVLADIGKNDIRTISKQFGIDNHDKPAMACLASRIPYGNKITAENLKMTEDAEEFIKNLGYQGIRVRSHNEIARIEFKQEDIKKASSTDSEKILDALKKIGYKFVCIDLAGYKTGSLNELLDKSS